MSAWNENVSCSNHFICNFSWMVRAVMNMMCLLFLFALLLQTSSTFKQDEYRVINERCELVYYNRDYFSNTTFALSLVNRTTRAFNFRAHFLRDMSTKIELVIQFYKFLSNEYRLFPVTLPINICHALQIGDFGIDDIKKHSNVIGCPFKKGQYYIRDFIPDYTKYPPHVPFGRYKGEMKFYQHPDFVLEMHWYGKFEEIIKWN